MFRRPLLVILILAGSMGITAATRLQAAEDTITSAQLPAGFALKTLVYHLVYPTDMAFLPNGDILVTEKGTGYGDAELAHVRLVRNGVLRADPVLTLGVNTIWESGLQTIAIDPDFEVNHFVYLWYATGQSAIGWDGASTLRLSRFRLDVEAGVIDPASEEIILGGLAWSEVHHGGSMIFDGEGNLLLGIGDGGSFIIPNIPIDRSQDMATLRGKVLRIRPGAQGYTVPADNPFVGEAMARPEIYALGLRNPYRMAYRAADDSIYLADVGSSKWEEIDRLEPGANYGWPLYEGPCAYGDPALDCATTPISYTRPLVYYLHDVQSWGAITALVFYDFDGFPAELRGRPFFADFVARTVATAKLENGGFTIEPFAQSVGQLVDMEATSSGLYVLDHTGGTLSLIYYTGADNHVPVAALALEPGVGRAPLRVTLSAAGSTDSDDLFLEYHWDFGDGQQTITTSPGVEHVYQTDGNYTASLKVVDARGGESETISVPVTVYSGEFPKIELSNLTEPGRANYYGGDRVQYKVSRRNGAAGLDADTPYTWDIDFYHNDLVQQTVSQAATDAGILNIATATPGLAVNDRYRFSLTMHTATGQEVRVQRDLLPTITTLQLESWPAPTNVSVNQEMRYSGESLPAIVGQVYQLRVAPTLFYAGNVGEFAYWLVADGWPVAAEASAQRIVTTRTLSVTTPLTPTTVMAFYEYARPGDKTFLPFVSEH